MKANLVTTNDTSHPDIIPRRGGANVMSKRIVWLLVLGAGLAPALAQKSHTVIINDPGAWGQVSPSPGPHTYPSGEVVAIQATPAPGYQFVSWLTLGGVGVANHYSNSTTMTVSGDGGLTAVFAPQFHVTLLVCTPENGTVDPSPGAHVYADQFEPGKGYRIPAIVIQATPDPNYEFRQWTLTGPATINQPRSPRATLTLSDLDNATVKLCPEFQPLSAANAVIVPNVVGQTQSQASAALTAAGLVVGKITQSLSETVPIGQVSSQDYAAGARVARGSTVNLTISRGALGAPVGYWKLDETKGAIAADSAGGNFGVLYGSPTWLPTSGKIGGALGFDGNDDYVSLPIGPLLSGLTRSSFLGWVNWTGRGGAGQHIFNFGSEPADSMFLTPNGPDGLGFAISVTGGSEWDQATAASVLPTGWHHFAVTIDPNGQTHILFLDGQVVARNTKAKYTPSMLGATRGMYNFLGRSQDETNARYKGELDDFRIYQTVLTDKQIATAMAGANETQPADLVARWAFDEKDGRRAADSAGHCDGTVMGDPVWQPGGGKVGGALKFDGADDGVVTDFVLNPATGPFSVFAWIQSSTGGRVILSQDGSTGGTDWLATSAAGRLMTALGSPNLNSSKVVTDGQWHEVGLTWAGTSRTLYVDGTALATDKPGAPASSMGGLNIGTGKNLDPGTFWSGLIDDVRIHKGAVKP